MSTPALASDDLETLIKTGDHRKLEMYYVEEAKNLKTRADKWEFIAEYYEKFPEEYPAAAKTCISISRISAPWRTTTGRPCMKRAIWLRGITH